MDDEMTVESMLDRVEAIARAIGCLGSYGTTRLTIDSGALDSADPRMRRYAVALSVCSEDGTPFPNATVGATVTVPRADGRPTMRSVAEALRAMAAATAAQHAKTLAAAMEKR